MIYFISFYFVGLAFSKYVSNTKLMEINLNKELVNGPLKSRNLHGSEQDYTKYQFEKDLDNYLNY